MEPRDKSYSNTGRALMMGGELSTLWNVNATSFLVGGMKYVYGRDFEADPLPQMPPVKINFAYNLQLWTIHFSPEGEWSAAQPRLSHKFNERGTGAYWLFHLKVKREFSYKNHRLQLYGGIENLFNKAYREHFDVGSVLRPGRNIFFRVKADF